MNSAEKEFLKDNIIALVRDHKKNCNDPACGVSMFFVGSLVKEAGIELTKEESQEFI